MGALAMSRKERARLEVMARVRDGQLTVAKAAGLLGLSLRQARRAWKRFREQADAGLVHGLRGKASNRKTGDATRTAVLALYREKYHDFGPTLACEYLAKDGYEVSHDTLGRWLRAEGLMVRRRKRGRHRSRRDRRELAGELVQMDGSHHAWFEGRGGAAPCCLMVLVDDATGRVYARFYERETLDAAFDVFGRYARVYGLPRALYVDRAGTYRSDKGPTAEQLLAGEEPVTQFGRAMRDLGVELILANSPQAKGRVERMNRTLQDRLVKEMRLRGVGDIASANALLDGPDGSFLAEFNEQFRVEPAGASDAHRPWAGGTGDLSEVLWEHEVRARGKCLVAEFNEQCRVEPAGRCGAHRPWAGVTADLSEVLCEHEERAVGKDWCVQWRGRLLQIDRAHEALSLPGRRLTVREKADGTVQVLWDGRKLSWHPVERRPQRAKRAKAKRPVVNNKRWTPPPEHPWKRRTPAAPPAPAARASSATPPQPLPPGQGNRRR